MASVLKVDEMQGVTSAGDITITGEGGTVHESLQQGLCKAWLNMNLGGSTLMQARMTVFNIWLTCTRQRTPEQV